MNCEAPRPAPRFPPNVEASIAWERRRYKPPAPHPPPEVLCRSAEHHEVPRNAARLAEQAEKAGWTVQIDYARGTLSGSRSGRVVDAVVMLLGGRKRRLLGIWHDGAYAVGWISRPGEPLKRLAWRQLAAMAKGSAT